MKVNPRLNDDDRRASREKERKLKERRHERLRKTPRKLAQVWRV